MGSLEEKYFSMEFPLWKWFPLQKPLIPPTHIYYMRQNIFEKISAENAIFKNEKYLYPEFVPDKLEYRDSQIDSMVYALNPILQGRKPHNLFLYGPTGTGKTACAKFVINSLEEHSDRGKGLYLNCFEFDSRSSILAQITNFLGMPVPRRGVAADEAYETMLSAMEKADFTPLLILDEVDQLLRKADGSRLLYDLLRVVQYKTLRFALVMVSNDTEFTSKLDARVKSSLAEETVEFPSYSPQQLKGILKARTDQAFLPGALGEDVINVAAAHAAKHGGDARIAIEALWKAGREAERQNAKTLNLDHLYKIFPTLFPTDMQKALTTLSEDEKLILQATAGEGTLTSGQLYEKYKKIATNPLGERRIRSLVIGLEAKNLLSAEYKKGGNKGNTKEISSAIPKENLEQALKNGP